MKIALIVIMILLSQKSFSQNANTEIIPTLNHKLNGNTLLYCPTFEISWYNLKQSLFHGEDIEIAHSPFYIKSLNAFSGDVSSLNSKNCLFYSGMVVPSTADSLNKLIGESFPGITTDFTKFIDKIISYACIDLKFSYQKSFNISEEPLVFDGQKVKSFGIKYDPDEFYEIGKQVNIIDYQSDENFILEIGLSNKEYEIYLAKVPSLENISEIYNRVFSRIKTGKRDTLFTNDVLQIPVIDLETKKIYSELMNKNFKNSCCKKLSLNYAFQSIRFKIDEKGVDFTSEATEDIFCMPKHVMIFNKPFLILIKDVTSVTPLFVGWIENSEYMIKK